MPSIGSVVDLFCGVGGLTHGFVLERIPVVAGVDIDPACKYPYEANNGAPFIQRDISSLMAGEVASWFIPRIPRILVGCAPCQPFSTYNQKNDDPKWRLLGDFGRIVAELRPEIVSIENVPQLARFRSGTIFEGFGSLLQHLGYQVSVSIVSGPDYGVPQSRKRLVLLASLLGDITLQAPTPSPSNGSTVRTAISHLEPLEAGQQSKSDRLHWSSGLSEKNLARIRASVPGGSWRDWTDDLVASCHKSPSGKGYRGVYGRMEWDAPSPTITTQFHGFGNGRFGHPDQDRAISLREGAILQSFPPDYKFVAPEDPIYFSRIGRLIGNAVPVLIGSAIANSIREHLGSHVLSESAWDPSTLRRGQLGLPLGT